MALSSGLESTVLNIPEVFVYKVPPLRSASGHRAEDWGLGSPLFTGVMKVYQADIKLRICIYSFKDPKTLNTAAENLIFFGQCPIDVKPKEDITPFVDAVIDSSRYYVLRIKDPASNRTTLIGIGFRERDIAFDFKTVLNDYVRYVDRMALADKMASANLSFEEESKEGSVGEVGVCAGGLTRDLSIKPGEKISVKVRARKGAGGGGEESTTETMKATRPVGLRPPPRGATVFNESCAAGEDGAPPCPELTTTVTVNETDPIAAETNEDDWGDFESST